MSRLEETNTQPSVIGERQVAGLLFADSVAGEGGGLLE
jgi:hypothetical protein